MKGKLSPSLVSLCSSHVTDEASFHQTNGYQVTSTENANKQIESISCTTIHIFLPNMKDNFHVKDMLSLMVLDFLLEKSSLSPECEASQGH